MNKYHITARRTAHVMAICMGLGLCPATASAAGVLAGTLIENTATASFSSGSANNSVSSNTVTVRVDELLDVAVAGLIASPVSTGSASALLEYQVTNTGNGSESFTITVDPANAGNAFDAAVQTIAYDSNGNGVYDAGVDTAIVNGGAIPALEADGTLKIFVLANLPAGATDGQTSQVKLTASALTGTGAAGTVFPGQGAGGGDAVVGASGASDSALNAMIASLATVTLTKSAVVIDPFGGSQPVPGAVISYTLVANVGGTGQAETLTVADVIPTGTTYQPNSLKLDNNPLTDAVDSDLGSASSSGIIVNIGSVAGGATKIVTFSVIID